MLHVIHGDATCPDALGRKYIVHVCNDMGGWGRGFVLALSSRWKMPEQRYRAWKGTLGDGLLPLGEYQIVEVEKDIAVVNLVAQHGFKSAQNPCPFQFESFKLGIYHLLNRLNTRKNSPFSLHMPAGIGSGLAGGNKADIHAFLTAIAAVFDVYLYEWIKEWGVT